METTGLIIGLISLAVIAALIAYGVSTLIDNAKAKQKTLEKISKEIEELKKDKNTPE